MAEKAIKAGIDGTSQVALNEFAVLGQRARADYRKTMPCSQPESSFSVRSQRLAPSTVD